ncbi:MAG TPA: site-specific integrase [Woeseiaceae bacterium]|nr:site-specific integrase [Woeseiaceae bacterium]
MLIESRTGLPLHYPNLYVTTQVRNRSLSHSSMAAALAGIKVFLDFVHSRDIDLRERFVKKRFLTMPELDALSDYSLRDYRADDSLASNSCPTVARSTQYHRLSTIANYIAWLGATIPSGRLDRVARSALDQTVARIKARRPRNRNRASSRPDRSLSADQIEAALGSLDPTSETNPFVIPGVRERNWVIFLLLYHLGLRSGELLGLRIRDVDFQKCQVVVARRPDERDDPRVDQPLAKTLDRRLPMSAGLSKLVHNYVVGSRRAFSAARKHDFLFVTHAKGACRGQPISRQGFNALFRRIRSEIPLLENLTPHRLRHTWNKRFSDEIDAMSEPISTQEEEKIRSYLMGWREGSGTSSVYNRRHIEDKAQLAALALQRRMWSDA